MKTNTLQLFTRSKLQVACLVTATMQQIGNSCNRCIVAITSATATNATTPFRELRCCIAIGRLLVGKQPELVRNYEHGKEILQHAIFYELMKGGAMWQRKSSA